MVGGGPLLSTAVSSRSMFSRLKDVMLCGAPSSEILKSSRFRSVIGRPLLSVTRTSTRTMLTWLRITKPPGFCEGGVGVEVWADGAELVCWPAVKDGARQTARSDAQALNLERRTFPASNLCKSPSEII